MDKDTNMWNKGKTYGVFVCASCLCSYCHEHAGLCWKEWPSGGWWVPLILNKQDLPAVVSGHHIKSMQVA